MPFVFSELPESVHESSGEIPKLRNSAESLAEWDELSNLGQTRKEDHVLMNNAL
jgi:hypothetical protein